MYSFQDKLNSLTESSVWIFTKQSISFDTAYKAVKLLAEMPNRDSQNVESYFAKNHAKYNIDTDRHRVLVISQLFGLLTKTLPYERGGRYNIEQPTEIFEMIDKYDIGSHEYNTIKTEQILKIKIKAIIDTTTNNFDWNILPTIFSYRILKILKDIHNITSVNLDKFFTYVMTCKNYSEIDSAVQFIIDNCPITTHVNNYRERSRFLTLCQNNFNLFIIDNDTISINDEFDEYFNHMFMEKFDIDELNIQLSRHVDYTYFLTTYQEFNINLIDTPVNQTIIPQQTTKKATAKKVTTTNDGIIEDDDVDYVLKVNKIKEININPDIAVDASKVIPTITSGAIAKRYSKNPIIGKIAIQQANYLCEHINEHVTFISSTTMKQFMEAHHLIPISYQEEMWEKFNINIDCIENIVSLCPICHSAIHYAEKSYKIEIITNIFNQKKDILKNLGINLTLDELLLFYLK